MNRASGAMCFFLQCYHDQLLTLKGSSTQLEQVLGYTRQELAKEFQNSLEMLCVPFRDLPSLQQEVTQQLEEDGEAEVIFQLRRKDGADLWMLGKFRHDALQGGRAVLYVMLTDITRTVRIRDDQYRALRHLAERDSLTKLLNKSAIRSLTEQYLLSSPQPKCAMFMIDLDNFKQVNDRYGHLFGDAVLTQAAKTIRKLFRNEDFVGRVGGDEFMVLMCGTDQVELVEERCRELVEGFRTLFRTQFQEQSLSCSIGVALCPLHGQTYHELFVRADQALYQTKAAGKNSYSIYDPDLTNPEFLRGIPSVSTPIDSDTQPGLAGDSLLRFAFQKLYQSEDVYSAISDILEFVGKQMNVSRIYIFENNADNTTCSNTFEWCNKGVSPQIDNLKDIRYDTDIPGYQNNFDERGIFYCPDIYTLPQEYIDILEPQGIKSLLQCSILDNGRFRGYVGFDECTASRLWTQEQIDVLTFISKILSIFLLKQRASDEMERRFYSISTILDCQQARIYVLDPDTYRLHFFNAAACQYDPDLMLGMVCHSALMKREQPCTHCPARNIRERKSGDSIVMTPNGERLLSEAVLINWKGKEACMVTCRQLPADL